MRPIDADALIDELQKDEAKFDKEAEDAQNAPSYTECYSDAMWSRANGIRDAIIEVYDAPTIDAVSEWIPCSERLPSKKGEYLVSATIHFIPDHVDNQSTYEDVKIAFYSMGYGWLDAENVTAWMPLPQPYGERKGE